MKSKHLHLAEDFGVTGIMLRTSPERAAVDIPQFWARFMGEDIPAKVRAKSDGWIYAVYCDYETDERGPYAMVLGVASEAGAAIPAGMRRVRVPFGEYASFAVQGDPAKVVWQAWMHVNTDWEGRKRRRYIADYERYATATLTPTTVEAEIVVGVS